VIERETRDAKRETKFAGAAGLLDFSAAAKADGNVFCVDNHGHLTPSTGIFEHAPETFLVFQHVDVFEGYLAAGEILTGSRSIRSKIFAENQDGIRAHGIRSSFPKLSCPR